MDIEEGKVTCRLGVGKGSILGRTGKDSSGGKTKQEPKVWSRKITRNSK